MHVFAETHTLVNVSMCAWCMYLEKYTKDQGGETLTLDDRSGREEEDKASTNTNTDGKRELVTKDLNVANFPFSFRVSHFIF